MFGLGAWDVATLAAALAVVAAGALALRTRRDPPERDLGRYLVPFGLAMAVGLFAMPREGISMGWAYAARASESLLAIAAIVGLAALARSLTGGASGRIAIGAFVLGALGHVPDKAIVWSSFAADPAPLYGDLITFASNSTFDAMRLALVCAALHLAIAPRPAPGAPLVATALLVYGFGYTMWADGDEIARGAYAEGSELLVHGALLAAITLAWLARTREGGGAAARNAALAGWVVAVAAAFLFAAEVPVRGSSALWALQAVLLVAALSPGLGRSRA